MEAKRAPARLTALRRVERGRVALDVNGAPWRTVPDVVVVRARLALGLDLDRPLLREIRRELRRAEALERAGRTLARRDVSEADLRARLERGGVAPATVDETADTLRRAGALDDERFARGRAQALSERGWGNTAIVARLEAEGAPSEAAREALTELPPEPERAQKLVEGSTPRKAASLLARRGFDHETAESVLPALDGDTPAGLP